VLKLSSLNPVSCPSAARPTSGKSTLKWFAKPEAPTTPKTLSSRKVKNRVLLPTGLNPQTSPATVKPTSGKNTRRCLVKPETPTTPKMLSSRLAKNRVLKPIGLSPLSDRGVETTEVIRSISRSERTAIELLEISALNSSVSRHTQLNEKPELLQSAEPTSLQGPGDQIADQADLKSTAFTPLPKASLSLANSSLPADHLFLGGFVLTSNALYGVSSDEEQEVTVRREDSVVIKETKPVHSTGSRDSNAVVPNKANSSILLLQKQVLRRGSGGRAQ
jgi:hypothetical protein